MLSPRLPALAALVLVLAGCARHREPIAVVPAPAPVVAYQPPAPPPVSPINRGLSSAARVWHLRVGLNVAALACRGPQEAVIVAGYNALLNANKAGLRTAEAKLAAEYQASGGAQWRDRYDDAMTRLYNYFSQSFARDGFCQEAGSVLADGATVTPEQLGAFALARLQQLDRPFTQFYAAYDAWRGGQPMTAPPRFAPPVIAVASSTPVAAVPVRTAPIAPPVAIRAAPVRTAALVAPVRSVVPVVAPMPAPVPTPVPAPIQPKLDIDLSAL